MPKFKVLRTYTEKSTYKTVDKGFQDAVYHFSVESMVEGDKEARCLKVSVEIPSSNVLQQTWFSADDFIPYFEKHRSKVPFSHTTLMAQDTATVYVANYLNDKTAGFPIAIIFQIIVFILMELYRYWRDKKRYEELEKTYHDTIITYNENEYMRSDEVLWDV